MDKNISEIKDKNFFFSKNGAKNPKDEMLATIDAFFFLVMKKKMITQVYVDFLLDTTG